MIREHSFNIAVATVYGVEKAIILWRFCLFIQKHKADEEYFVDGRTWTYQPALGLTSQFPYWSRQKIQRLLQSLVNDNILVKDARSVMPWDRSMWYAFTNEDRWLSVETLHCSVLGNALLTSEQSRALSDNTVSRCNTVEPTVISKPQCNSPNICQPILEIINSYRKSRFGLKPSEIGKELIKKCIELYGLEECTTVAHYYFGTACTDAQWMKPENGFRPTKFKSKLQSAEDHKLSTKQGKQHGKPSRENTSKNWLREQGLQF